MNVGSLKSSKRRLEVRISQSNNRRRLPPVIFRSRRSASHIDHDNELDTGIREPSVGGEALIDSLQQTQILINSLVVMPDVEDVEACIEQEGEL